MKRRAQAAVVVAVLSAGCSGEAPPQEPQRARPPLPEPAALRAATLPAAKTVRAEVTPLPDDACADCHPDEVEGFRKTGMGRSLAPVTQAPRIEDWTKAEVHHGPTGFTYRAFIDESGRWWQEERLPGTDYTRRVEVKYVVGSGNHTRSYLGEVDGGVVQLPLTWYAGRRIWDMSPGYQGTDNPRFSRTVEAACLFCHNDLTPAADGISHRYEKPLYPGISCVRCHGDGAAHIALREAGKGPPDGSPDPSIFNPAHETAARQLQVCQQCHLQADTTVLHAGERWDRYSPDAPLDAYLSVFTQQGRDGDDFAIASHGRRLALSRCAQVSGDALRCPRKAEPASRAWLRPNRASTSCTAGAPTPSTSGSSPTPSRAAASRSGTTTTTGTTTSTSPDRPGADGSTGTRAGSGSQT